MTDEPEGGPEKAEEPTAAHDGEPNGNGGRASVAEQAADERPLAPEPPPIAADEAESGGQLTFAGVVPRRIPVEYGVIINQASTPGSGLLDPSKEGQLLVSYEFQKYVWTPIREHGKIVRWRCDQQLRPTFVMKPEQWPEFVEEQKRFDEEDARTPAIA